MTDAHGDLGALLRAWRDRRSPADVGLPVGSDRRALGLRREELAALAGLSVDYVVRLEQGRARNPSDQVAAALARALQLDDVERDHLYRLAGLLSPTSATVSRHIPPGVQRLVARLGEVPIAVFTASWDLLTWSPLWAALLGDPSTRYPDERNLVALTFGGRALAGANGSEVQYSDGPEPFHRSLVADLRRVQGRHPSDERLRALIDGLLQASEEFAAIWHSGQVGEQQSESKIVVHPTVGPIQLDCDVLSVVGSDLRIVAYTAATGTPDAEKLEFLRVTGVTALAGAAPERPARNSAP